MTNILNLDTATHRSLDTSASQVVISDLVDAFAVQDLDRIMAHFAEGAVFADIIGRGQSGALYRGKGAIAQAFSRQFDLLGEHTYVDACISTSGHKGFAAWTLAVGRHEEGQCDLFDGIDYFTFDNQGQVLSKQAWLKDHGRLQRTIIRRNFPAVLKHARYSLFRS